MSENKLTIESFEEQEFLESKQAFLDENLKSYEDALRDKYQVEIEKGIFTDEEVSLSAKVATVALHSLEFIKKKTPINLQLVEDDFVIYSRLLDTSEPVDADSQCVFFIEEGEVNIHKLEPAKFSQIDDFIVYLNLNIRAVLDFVREAINKAEYSSKLSTLSNQERTHLIEFHLQHVNENFEKAMVHEFAHGLRYIQIYKQSGVLGILKDDLLSLEINNAVDDPDLTIEQKIVADNNYLNDPYEIKARKWELVLKRKMKPSTRSSNDS